MGGGFTHCQTGQHRRQVSRICFGIFVRLGCHGWQSIMFPCACASMSWKIVRILWVAHALFAYVDDFFLIQNKGVIELCSSLILAFCACFSVPISWAKLQLGLTVRWIGWNFHLGSCTFSLPEDKLAKILHMCLAVLKPKTTSKKELESLIGLLHWVIQIVPHLKPWLSCLYEDMARPLATSFSLNPGVWAAVPSALDDKLVFTSSPAGSGIPVGGKLLSAKHVELRRKSDLRLVQPSGKRLWLRVADPRTSKRRLSALSKAFLQFWLRWAMSGPTFRMLRSPPAMSPQMAAADAMAQGDKIGIGGFASFGEGHNIWFSERFAVADFLDLGVLVQAAAERDITSYETLAQHALLMLVATAIPSGRLCVRLQTLSDNTGAESSINKMFSTTYPVCLFLQKMATFSALSGIALEVGHVPGANDQADFLSRWDGVSALPAEWQLSHRVDLPLSRLWHFRTDVRVWPADATLLWDPPRD